MCIYRDQNRINLLIAEKGNNFSCYTVYKISEFECYQPQKQSCLKNIHKNKYTKNSTCTNHMYTKIIDRIMISIISNYNQVTQQINILNI